MTAAAGGSVRKPPSDRAPGPLRRFRGPVLSYRVLPVDGTARERKRTPRGWPDATSPSGQPLDHSVSPCFATALIAASDLRTWLRSVVYQKSGSDALRYLPYRAVARR